MHCNLHMHVCLILSLWHGPQDDLEYKEYSYNEPAKSPSLKVFEAPRPYGKRIVTLQIDFEGIDKESLVFAGRIYEYCDRFQAKEIHDGFPGIGDGDKQQTSTAGS